jgi:hypothetical protein
MQRRGVFRGLVTVGLIASGPVAASNNRRWRGRLIPCHATYRPSGQQSGRRLPAELAGPGHGRADQTGRPDPWPCRVAGVVSMSPKWDGYLHCTGQGVGSCTSACGDRRSYHG